MSKSSFSRRIMLHGVSSMSQNIPFFSNGGNKGYMEEEGFPAPAEM
jgi:hypothetical protein